MCQNARYFPAGDSALIMELGNEISPAINSRIREIAYMLENENIKGIVETVPTYRSIMVVYDPMLLDYSSLIERLKYLESQRGKTDIPPAMVTEIPTVYGGEYGPDIEFVASHNGVTVEDVVQIHCSTNYLIYMLGFTPGFPYLGGMSERIAAPRLEVPRERITAGSVGIAGKQTGIYPINSPGGWRIIGRTPLKLFDPGRKEPVLLKAGNYIRFVPVEVEEFKRIEAEVEESRYCARTYPLEEGEDDDF
ncbi:MAG: Allophanate hydrolase 2 subunit 1 [Firmicutes bacterium]|jgi:KipI family sensor histidine kinase inhibitor|nr:Allophanate hydrolase 2 subunit 1 [Bacillota bacterium]NSW91956.1 5-oxoprolinase subunit PxpB [Bacillota bacterium]